MRWKEFSLWLGFLCVCFGAGYLHGHLPEVRLQFLFSGAEKVRVVVFERSLFGPNLVKILQEQTHTEIQIEEVKTWQEARLKTVLNPGVHLLFLPSHWIPPLIREGRLRTVTSMKSVIEKEIAPELRSVTTEKLYEVPLFWTIFQLATPNEFKDQTLESVLDHPKIRSIQLYHDPEYAQSRLVQEPWNYPKIKSKIQLSAEIQLQPSPEIKDRVIEIPLHQSKDLLNANFGAINKKPLFVFSLAVPNNSPQRSTSLALIEALLTSEEFDEGYSALPVGSTLNRLNSKLPDRIKRASYLKEIPFKELDLPVLNEQ